MRRKLADLVKYPILKQCGDLISNDLFFFRMRSENVTLIASNAHGRHDGNGRTYYAPGYPAIGVISIAGPLMRLDVRLMESLGADHLTAAKELANNSPSSPIFNRAV